MKIILTLIICSALNDTCDFIWTKDTKFPDWNSCMRQGYNDSLRAMDIMGANYVNKNQMFIKFACKEMVIENNKLNKSKETDA